MPRRWWGDRFDDDDDHDHDYDHEQEQEQEQEKKRVDLLLNKLLNKAPRTFQTPSPLFIGPPSRDARPRAQVVAAGIDGE